MRSKAMVQRLKMPHRSNLNSNEMVRSSRSPYNCTDPPVWFKKGVDDNK